MALTDVSDGSRILEFTAGPVKVTLARACKAGDILGVAEDNFDDLGPVYTDVDAHSTSVTYVPRLVAGQSGSANDEITAYAIAVVKGCSSAVAFKKVYMAQTSGTTGQMSETAPTTTGMINAVIGMSIATNRVLLYPALASISETNVS